MANISYEEILSIQRKANIVDIIRDYVPLTQRGKNYFGICPFHDDHNPSMSVSPEKGVYKCFVCGNAGNVFNFVMEYEKVSFYEAVKIVADKIGVSIDISTSKKENTKKSPLYDVYNIAYKFYQNNLNTVYGKDAKKYLLNRKIDEDVIKNFNIGLSLSDSELCNALKAKGFKDDDIVSSGVAVQNGNNIYDIYGALVKNKCVCEGYAKAFKYLVDNMNIPCVMVIGKATNSNGTTENHAWNYVQINQNWYAVDCTWDDPVIIGNGKVGNETKYKYFLRGSSYINRDHISNGQFTDGGETYQYPALSVTDYR